MKKTIPRWIILASAILVLQACMAADEPPGAALSVSLDNIYRLYDVQSRSISPENFTGERGKAGMATEGTGQRAARDLGQGWKVSPSIEIKALGWQPGGRYLPLQDDVASVAFWYQQEPHKKFPQLPARDELEWH